MVQAFLSQQLLSPKGAASVSAGHRPALNGGKPKVLSFIYHNILLNLLA